MAHPLTAGTVAADFHSCIPILINRFPMEQRA